MCRAPILGIVLFYLAILPLRAEVPARVVPARTDHNGDPLPANVVARFGTMRFRTHAGIECMALSPDGKILVEGVEPNTLYFFETATGRLLNVVRFRVSEVQEVDSPVFAFRPDGRTLLYGRPRELPLQEIDLQTWKIKPVAIPNGTECRSLNRDGRYAVLRQELSNPKSFRLHVYDLQDAKTRYTIPRFTDHEGQGTPILSMDPHKSLVVYNVRSGDGSQMQVAIGDLQSGASDLSAPFDGVFKQFVFNSKSTELCVLTDKAAMRFDIEVSRQKLKLRLKANLPYPFENGANKILLSPDERYLLMTGTDGAISIWDLRTNQLIRNWNTRSYGIADLAFTPDGKTLITASSFESIPRFWDYETATDRNPHRGHRDRISGLQFDPSGKELISASDDGSIRIWNLQPTRVPIPYQPKPLLEERYRGSEKQILCETIAVFQGLWLTEDGKKLFANKNDEGIFSWERNSGKKGVLKVPILQNNDLQTLFLAPGGQFLAGIQKENLLRTLSLEDAKPLQIGEADVKYDSIAFHPDGRTVLALTQSGGFECWDIFDGKRVRSGRLADPDQPLRERFACVRSESTNQALIWNRTNGRVLAELPWPSNSSELSPNGRYLVDCDTERIQLTDVLTGQKLQWNRNPQSMSQVTCLRFSPNGQKLAIGFRNGLIELFDLRPPTPNSKPTEEELTKAWKNLVSVDQLEVWKAMGLLGSHSDRTVPWLAKKIVVPKGPDLSQVEVLLSRLDHPSFRVREKSTFQLRTYGDAIEARLDALENNPPSAEVGNRCRSLLRQLTKPRIAEERLRLFRVIEILESIGSEEAKRVLEKSFPTDDRFLRLAARDALERLRP